MTRLTMRIPVVLLAWCTFITWTQVSGHGRLMDPPSRSSMWRMGFSTPKNFEDNQLYCGGFTYQWKTQNGKCGICGDPYGGPRENEAGGKYATGLISRYYSIGASVNVRVDITAHHKGWFEFRLCPLTAGMIEATPECLDRHLLSLTDGSTRYYLPPSSSAGSFHVPIVFPDSILCDHCVLQWKYHTGNSWGAESDGHECIGCGPQEEFYGCADVAISSRADSNIGVIGQTDSTSRPTRIELTARSTASRTPAVQSATIVSSTRNPSTGLSQSKRCKAVGTYEGQPRMDRWCTYTCNEGSCLSNYCECTDETVPNITTATTTEALGCVAAGLWKGNSNMNEWCRLNCALGNCPEAYCSCSNRTTPLLTETTSSTPKTTPTSEMVKSESTLYTSRPPHRCPWWQSTHDPNNELLNRYCLTRCMITPEACDTDSHCQCAGHVPASVRLCIATAAYRDLPLVAEFCQISCGQEKSSGCDQICDCD